MKIVRLHKCSCILEQRSFHSHAEVGNGSCLAILLITTGKRIRLGEFFFFFKTTLNIYLRLTSRKWFAVSVMQN